MARLWHKCWARVEQLLVVLAPGQSRDYSVTQGTIMWSLIPHLLQEVICSSLSLTLDSLSLCANSVAVASTLRVESSIQPLPILACQPPYEGEWWLHKGYLLYHSPMQRSPTLLHELVTGVTTVSLSTNIDGLIIILVRHPHAAKTSVECVGAQLIWKSSH